MKRFVDYFKLATAGPDIVPHTRSLEFTRTWLKEFRYPNFTLSLIFSGNKHGAVLQGHYQKRQNGIHTSTNLIFMHETKEDTLTELHFDYDAPFGFMASEPGKYQLIAESEDEVFEIVSIII